MGQNNQENERGFLWRPEIQPRFPSEESLETLIIFERDWQSLCNCVNEIPEEKHYYRDLTFWCLAVSVSAFLAIIPIWNAQNIHPFTIPVMGFICFLALILTIIFWKFNLKMEEINQNHIEIIRREVRRIENTLQQNHVPQHVT